MTDNARGAMHADPRECMFCHSNLPVRPNEPANLAFLSHLREQPPCQEGFDAWTTHMQRDYIGY